MEKYFEQEFDGMQDLRERPSSLEEIIGLLNDGNGKQNETARCQYDFSVSCQGIPCENCSHYPIKILLE